ncbi:nucleotide exchange factor GrpE [Cryobacterium glaciale]|uniref:Nucleotide exchange factor GrpE n=1 Tax=Cryobacterium glaciale TaxID=1259145 RepID=A0A4V3I7Z9_9MICO|nr:nucleotide exchange factor GrpE [Cryobacterium glaciale]TFB71878.1 nucleotide exchange factor GrpE [Cryobacterium glaciale]
MSDSTAELADIRSELAGLKDLFLRRLLDDKTKSAQHELLQDQLRATQQIVSSRMFEGLFKESLLAIDRLQAGPASDELSASVCDELLDVFGQYSLASVAVDGPFDAKVHQLVETAAATSECVAGSITEVRRAGYLMNERLLRPAQVVVAIASSD